jgi:hypothetical protein
MHPTTGLLRGTEPLALLSPPWKGSPQVTTVASRRSAAKAKPVEKISWTWEPKDLFSKGLTNKYITYVYIILYNIICIIYNI